MALTDFISNQPTGIGGIYSGVGNTQTGPAPVAQAPSRNGANLVMGTLEQVLGANSPYLANARRRGLEVAGARGGINSSIAAGASERAALEAGMPLVQQALDINATEDNVQQQNWLSQQNFGRALYGQRFNSSLDMLRNLQQAAIQDPELYSPEVTSGFSNFFERNTADIMKRYFGE